MGNLMAEGKTEKAESATHKLVKGSRFDSRHEENELVLCMDEYESESLESVKTLWFFGEWDTLAELDLNALRRHPDRDRFALLAASANQQMGRNEKARDLTRLALKWGCPPGVIAQVLVADVHNTLGRASALKKDETRITKHFEASVAISGKKKKQKGHARSVREMTRLGMLPKAASFVGKKLKESDKNFYRPEQQQAQIEILQTELELFQHELSLAQQRQQLYNNLTPTPDPSNPEWLKALEKKAVSQLGQELWVLEKTKYKSDGFFVEFGATDGVLLSNTWLLEMQFGWQGICAEPNQKLYKRLRRNRNCTVSSACIGEKSGEKVEFIFADAYGGMLKYAHEDMHKSKREAYHSAGGGVTVLTTISLHDFLLEHDAPKIIDYLSIDTEGSEFEILKSFPFDKWNIRLLTIEHNFTERRKDIRGLLESHGYCCMEQKFDDWYEKVD
jgi:FkbM family methyltransferase